MKTQPPALGPKLHGLRRQQKMTLDMLASASGVSRSMLSQIERGEANPTFGTLWNLTQALGVDFTALTGGESGGGGTPIELLEPHFTPQIRTEDGGCLLRILSPPSMAGGTEWYHLTLKGGAVLKSEAHGHKAMEHLTALNGDLEVRSGDHEIRIPEHGTARYRADLRHEIRNPGLEPAEGILVVQVS